LLFRPARQADTEGVLGELFLLGGLSLGAPDALTLAGFPTGEREVSVALVQSDDSRNRSDEARALFRDLNAIRAAKGLRPLTLEPRLCEIADSHAADMVARRYFGHDTPEGVSPFGRMDRAGWHYGYAGENLALDVDEQAASRTLYRSNGHRDNMLEPHYRHVGIAAVQSAEGEIFVEDFSD
jgi:uncharacterized protein YkwD